MSRRISFTSRASSVVTLAAATLLPLGCRKHPQPAAATPSNTAAQPSTAAAEGAGSPWQGNWGGFAPTPAAESKIPGQRTGEGLVIRDCAGNACTFRIMVAGPGLNGSGEGTVELRSPTEAVLHMNDLLGTMPCSLRALRSTGPDTIRIEQGGGKCSDYVTGQTTFNHTYPLHSRAAIVDPDMEGCYAASTPAQTAICTHADLSKQADAFVRLFGNVYELQHKPDPNTRTQYNDTELKDTDRAKAAILDGCDNSHDVPACLHDAFAHNTAALNGNQSNWFTAAVQPGDPAQGKAEAERIAGSYRNHFANGDVEGDHYRSTDTLKVTLRADGGIDYDTHLEYYNGHECNLNGTARFARNGMFVDQQKQDSDTAPLCTFQIEPGKEGVTFHDPNGSCRELNCGMRGSFEGSTFAFKDRIKP